MNKHPSNIFFVKKVDINLPLSRCPCLVFACFELKTFRALKNFRVFVNSLNEKKGYFIKTQSKTVKENKNDSSFPVSFKNEPDTKLFEKIT